jgi:phospholipid/cholesterol/gamma-HCH transport system substrate-binding protein
MYDYTKHIRLSRLKVGLLVTIGLIILTIGLLFSGSIGNLFAPRVTIYALFSNIQGLTSGAPVWFAGKEIGSVKNLQFEQSQIRATLKIEPIIIKYLKTDSDAEILTLGLLGNKYISLTPGTPGANPLPPGGTLHGTIERGFQDVVESSEQVIRRVDRFIAEIQKLLGSPQSEKGTLALLLSDPALYENLATVTQNLSDLLSSINQGRGTLGQLITDKRLYEQLLASAHAINDFSTRLASASGSLHDFIEDPALYDNLRQASQTLSDLLQEIKSGQGSLGQLIQGKDLYLALDALVRKMNATMAEIDAGRGTLGQLVSNDQIARELSQSIQELQKLIKDIRDNPRRYFNLKLF